jgi:hypothetical protein
MEFVSYERRTPAGAGRRAFVRVGMNGADVVGAM